MPAGNTARRRLLMAVLALLSVAALSACLTPGATPTPTATATRPPRPTFTPIPAAAPPTATPATAASATRPPATATPAPPTATSRPAQTPTPTVNPNVNPLTGLAVSDPALLRLRPFHVCIDNDPASRPQMGLDKADVVYEYVMERFYNTRFTAVYWGQAAERIGPIRSARLVNLELTPQYDAMLACSGGSDAIRWLLITDKRFFDYLYLDIDLMDPQLRYFSIYGKNSRVGANLLQTSTAVLRKWLQDNSKERAVTVRGFTFAAAKPTAMAATSVAIPYPSSCCAVEWTYDAATGRYRRTMNGEPHTDGVSKAQLSAANVIVVYAPHEDTDIVEDSTGATAIRYVLTGEGKASVFRDGVAIAALWRRAKLGDFMQIVDATGAPIALRPGNVWIEIAPDIDFEVTFK